MTTDSDAHRTGVLNEKVARDSPSASSLTGGAVAIHGVGDTDPKNGDTATAPPPPPPQMSFPEGGLRAWLVVLGSSMLLGCSFGWISSFG